MYSKEHLGSDSVGHNNDSDYRLNYITNLNERIRNGYKQYKLKRRYWYLWNAVYLVFSIKANRVHHVVVVVGNSPTMDTGRRCCCYSFSSIGGSNNNVCKVTNKPFY